MPQIDKYIAGSVNVVSGSATITGVSTAWSDVAMTKFSVLAGHFIRIGAYVGLIVSVNSPTQITVAPGYTGATANGLAYEIYRTTWVENSSTVGYLQAVLQRGQSSNPLLSLYLDSGAMRMAFRDDGAGNPALYVGGSGAADGSMIRAFYANKATGATYFLVPHADTYWFNSGEARFYQESGGIVACAGSSGSPKYFRFGADGVFYGLSGGAYLGGWTSIAKVASPQAALDVNGSVSVTDGSFFYTGYNGPSWTNSVRSGIQFDGANQYINFHVANTYRVAINPNGNLIPVPDNTQSLGMSGNRWSVVYAGSGSINTSDAALKQVRGGFTDEELDAWGSVHGQVFQFLDSIAAKGEEAARFHAGYIAQEVAAAFLAHGLDPARYALWCRDEITRTETVTITKQVQAVDQEEVPDIEIREGVPVQIMRTVKRPRVEMVAVVDEAGQPVRDEMGRPVLHPVPVMIDEEAQERREVPAGERLGLRYDQCAVIEAAWLRRELARQSARIAALETPAAA